MNEILIQLKIVNDKKKLALSLFDTLQNVSRLLGASTNIMEINLAESLSNAHPVCCRFNFILSQVSLCQMPKPSFPTSFGFLSLFCKTQQLLIHKFVLIWTYCFHQLLGQFFPSLHERGQNFHHRVLFPQHCFHSLDVI